MISPGGFLTYCMCDENEKGTYIRLSRLSFAILRYSAQLSPGLLDKDVWTGVGESLESAELRMINLGKSW
jgi:hypothetical protein